MRLLVEIFLIGALIYLGWEIPFKDRLPNSVVRPAPRTTVAVPHVRVVPSTPGGQWMVDPNRQATLGTPTPSGTHTSGSGSWMFDPNHRSALDPPRHKSPRPH